VAAALLLAAAVAGVLALRPMRRVLAAEAADAAAGIARANPGTAPHRSRPAAKPAAAAEAAHPVLVELFTSEGCSSCPTADTLLARLEREQPVPDADILALEEHVDYWDSPEWHDRFSSSQFSARQNTYTERLLLGSEYTPQMIVDGTEPFAGTDIVHAFLAIAHAARAPKLALMLSPLTCDGIHLAGKVSLPQRHAGVRQADLYAAVVESTASTRVLGGENNGATLNHVSVVRELRKIGSLALMGTAPLKFSLNVPADAAPANLRVVIFAQRSGQGAVLGAVSSPPAAPAHDAASIAAPEIGW
jgi:hypothetical protein